MNGEQKNMGTREFRVKRVPNPEPSLHNTPGKSVTRSRLSSVQGVVAVMKDFDFDLEFIVQSFTIEVISAGNYLKAESSPNNKFTEAQRKLMTEAKVGSKIYITNIKAKAKGSTEVRDLPGIDYQVDG
jgi:hypothetical protein